uniref:HMG box domain-containing protein n=1 Tax=Castor canadensis TaxID=51338 RepID=A0A8C0XZ53_CASCN
KREDKPKSRLGMASLHNQGYWSRNDILRLMERMEKNLPPDDSQAFKTTQACLDWGKVAFNRFSGEMCKLKWLEISHKLRKYRTLTELVVEAKERVADPYRSKGYKKHPDYPKRPLTAYIRFYKDKWAQYSQMYPKLNNQELTKVLSEKYKGWKEADCGRGLKAWGLRGDRGTQCCFCPPGQVKVTDHLQVGGREEEEVGGHPATEPLQPVLHALLTADPAPHALRKRDLTWIFRPKTVPVPWCSTRVSWPKPYPCPGDQTGAPQAAQGQ